MKTLKTPEIVILIFIWCNALSNLVFALFGNYILNLSDYLGLLFLGITTGIVILKPKKALISILILLVIGVFNVISFTYFYNITVSIFFIPSIQLFSLIVLGILVLLRKQEIHQIYNVYISKKNKKVISQKEVQKHIFKDKFKALTNSEIDYKLQQKLTLEAITALKKLSTKEKKRNYLKLNHTFFLKYELFDLLEFLYQKYLDILILNL